MTVQYMVIIQLGEITMLMLYYENGVCDIRNKKAISRCIIKYVGFFLFCLFAFFLLNKIAYVLDKEYSIHTWNLIPSFL